MPSIRDFTFGPWRAVLVLGVTQILAWGALFYPVVLTVPLIAAERGWSLTFTMSGFSLGLLAAGFAAPTIGRQIDRHGGHMVMPWGALAGAAALLGLAATEHPLAFLALWAVMGVAMASSLYDPAFATLGRIFGAKARRPITALTLAGGFASTVSWPVTHLCLAHWGWRGTYLFYAALLAIVAAPLLAFVLPRQRAEPTAPSTDPQRTAPVYLPARGRAFLLVAAAFAAYLFVPAALSAHLLAMFERLGLERTTAVTIGALFGPAQVAARIGEFTLASNVHPLGVARFAVGLICAAFVLLAAAGASPLVAAIFAVAYGAANGLMTIARGTLPLALFGPAGYGALIGRIAKPGLIIQSAAPLLVALVIERASDAAALALLAAMVTLSLVAFALIRRP